MTGSRFGKSVPCKKRLRLIINFLLRGKRFFSISLLFLLMGILAACSKTETANSDQIPVTGTSRLIISVGKSTRKPFEFQMENPLADSNFRGELKAEKTTVRMAAGNLSEVISVPLKIRNLSTVRWSSVGEDGGLSKLAISVGYHLYDKSGQLISWEGKRTAFVSKVEPGETVSIPALLEAPNTPGQYVYVFDLVQEGVAWFSGKGNQTLNVDATAF